jgi:RNA polymerase sigma-70 factor (ECF subfamily)
MDHRAASIETSSSPVRAALSALTPRLHARALRLSRSRADADDLVQETCLRALRFESTFAPGTNVRAWPYQILESVFISRCRSRTRERRALGRFSGDPTLGCGAVRAPEIQAVTTHVHQALHALPPKFLAVVELVDLRDHSYREAASELGVPVGTVMSRLFRARRLLQGSVTETLPRAA